MARLSSSDFLDALVAFQTFDSFLTDHVLFIDGAQRNSSDFELNFFEPKISEISLLYFFFSHNLKISVQPLFASKFHCVILSKEVRLLSKENLHRISGRSDSRDKMGGSRTP